jgi:peptidoglycan-associated lipoprotein
MKTRVMLIASMALLLAACHGNKFVKTAPPASDAGAAANTTSTPAGGTGSANGGSAAGMTAGAGGSSVNANSSAEPTALHTLYFDFDSSEIRGEYNTVLAEQARVLTRNAGTKLRLEGHTDERGSPEYNVGLGERRAQAVRRALLLQGVGESQLSTVSFGEERPAVAGSTEEAYAKNRRVELVSAN